MSASLKITILVDNQAGEGLVAEHGLSFWIETDGKSILFDTGQGGALATNAGVLGVDLSKTDVLVLSHGHYDHTGGIPYVLQNAGMPEVYCHPGAMVPRYSIREGAAKPVGMPAESKAAIDKFPTKHLHWTVKPVLLSAIIGITGVIPRVTDYEDVGGPFYLDPQGRIADAIYDDLALWIRTDKGLVVCVGCCHAGLINTLTHIRRLNGQAPIRAVLGGFHVSQASQERLDRTIKALREISPEQIVPCHCTGGQAVIALQSAFGVKVSSGYAGLQFCFD
jgi:7,8-dihydropterin-6-yl-methyl-4-(beta-D-ribofuranosyl)aminobenzene 5'-phosphate synthase